MRGYPKHIATKQDFLNLLSMREHQKQALKDLERLFKYDDSSALRAVGPVTPEDPEGPGITEKINNPNPIWRQKGFSSRQEIADILMRFLQEEKV